MTNENFLYGNNTSADLRPFHADIRRSLESNGSLPEYLAVPGGNPDGSPRFMIDAA